MKVIAIAAIDENNGIGYNNNLLVHIPEDMKYFKDTTTGKIVVMGKKTQETLPNKKLADRINVVLTSKDSPDEEGVYYMDYATFDRFLIMLQIYENGYERWQSFTDKKIPKPKDVFIIGGGATYKQLLPYCDTLEITHIYHKFENVDTYFPQIDPEEWEVTAESDLKTYEDLSYKFVTYERRKT